jgi:hypothetical protein
MMKMPLPSAMELWQKKEAPDKKKHKPSAMHIYF